MARSARRVLLPYLETLPRPAGGDKTVPINIHIAAETRERGIGYIFGNEVGYMLFAHAPKVQKLPKLRNSVGLKVQACLLGGSFYE